MQLVHSYQYGYGGLGDLMRSMFSYFVFAKINCIDYYLDFSKTDLRYCFDNSFDYQKANDASKNCLSFTQIGSKSDVNTEKYLKYLLDSVNSPDVVNIVFSNIFDFVPFDVLDIHKKEFLDFLKISDSVKNRIKELLEIAELKEKKFNSVHVRCGDHYMPIINIDSDSRINPNDSVRLILSIVEKNKSEGFETLLFTDNQALKNHHKELGTKTLAINIVHSSLGPMSNSEKDLEKNKKDTIDTVAEFFIMALSNSVISLKDSGFSYWSTFLHDVPLYNVADDYTLVKRNLQNY